MNDAHQQHADTQGQSTARHASYQHTMCSQNHWIWIKREKKCLINLPKKKSRTDIFHNLLNLDSLKDIQLLHSWSVLGYFFLVVCIHTNIGLYNQCNKSTFRCWYKNCNLLYSLNNSWLFTKEFCKDIRWIQILIWTNGKIRRGGKKWIFFFKDIRETKRDDNDHFVMIYF